MRPVVVTAVLLLVVLMSMSASAWNPELMCRTKYQDTPCRKNLGRGWFQFGEDRCVKAFLTPTLKHGHARKHCSVHFTNGDLVSIHSLRDLELVECAMYRVTTAKAHYWIGLKWTNKGYAWTDGSKYNYSYWAIGQPDSSWWKQENCVEMNYAKWGHWNDENCYKYRPFVCQAKL